MPTTLRVENFTGPGGTSVPRYVGYATPGTTTSVAMWRIARIDYDADDNVTGVLYADGNEHFDNVWDNRAALLYS